MRIRFTAIFFLLLICAAYEVNAQHGSRRSFGKPVFGTTTTDVFKVDGGYRQIINIYDNNTSESVNYIVFLDQNMDSVSAIKLPQMFSKIIQTADGGFFVVNNIYDNTAMVTRLHMARTNKDFDTSWTKVHNSFTYEAVSSVTEDKDGGILIAYVRGVTGSYMPDYLMKYNTKGELQWDERLYSEFVGSHINNIQLLKNGGYALAGYSRYDGYSNRVFVTKRDAAGKFVWTKLMFEPGAPEEGIAIVEMPNEDLLLITSRWSRNMVKLNKNGDSLWTKTGSYDDSVYYDYLYAFPKGNNGNFMIAGNKYFQKGFGFNSRPVSIEMDSAGNIVNETVYYNSNSYVASDYLRKAQMLSNGSMLLQTTPLDANFNTTLFETDSKGKYRDIIINNPQASLEYGIADVEGNFGNLTFNNIGTLKDLVISVYLDSVPAGLASGLKSISRHYRFDALGGTGFSADMKLPYAATELNGIDTTKNALSVYRQGAAGWQKIGGFSQTEEVSGKQLQMHVSDVTTFGNFGIFAETSSGLNEKQLPGFDMNVYPNPASDILNITYQLGRNANIALEIYNIQGVKMAYINQGMKNSGLQHIQIPTDALAPGMYICRIQADNNSRMLRFSVVR